MKDYKEAPAPKCLHCGRTITYGRTDRKFCSDSCKNTYNNFLRKVHCTYKTRIDKAIARNYTILNNLVKLKVDQITMAEAQAMGFNPCFVTSHSKESGHSLYTCYDISFRISESRIFNIRRLELYLQDSNNKK